MSKRRDIVIVMRHGIRRDAELNAPAEANPPLSEEGARLVPLVTGNAIAPLILRLVVGAGMIFAAEEVELNVMVRFSPFVRTFETAYHVRAALQSELERAIAHSVSLPRSAHGNDDSTIPILRWWPRPGALGGSEVGFEVENGLGEVYGPIRIKAAPTLYEQQELDAELNEVCRNAGLANDPRRRRPQWPESLEGAQARYQMAFDLSARKMREGATPKADSEAVLVSVCILVTHGDGVSSVSRYVGGGTVYEVNELGFIVCVADRGEPFARADALTSHVLLMEDEDAPPPSPMRVPPMDCVEGSAVHNAAHHVVDTLLAEAQVDAVAPPTAEATAHTANSGHAHASLHHHSLPLPATAAAAVPAVDSDEDSQEEKSEDVASASAAAAAADSKEEDESGDRTPSRHSDDAAPHDTSSVAFESPPPTDHGVQGGALSASARQDDDEDDDEGETDTDATPATTPDVPPAANTASNATHVASGAQGGARQQPDGDDDEATTTSLSYETDPSQSHPAPPTASAGANRAHQAAVAHRARSVDHDDTSASFRSPTESSASSERDDAETGAPPAADVTAVASASTEEALRHEGAPAQPLSSSASPCAPPPAAASTTHPATEEAPPVAASAAPAAPLAPQQRKRLVGEEQRQALFNRLATSGSQRSSRAASRTNSHVGGAAPASAARTATATSYSDSTTAAAARQASPRGRTIGAQQPRSAAAQQQQSRGGPYSSPLSVPRHPSPWRGCGTRSTSRDPIIPAPQLPRSRSVSPESPPRGEAVFDELYQQGIAQRAKRLAAAALKQKLEDELIRRTMSPKPRAGASLYRATTPEERQLNQKIIAKALRVDPNSPAAEALLPKYPRKLPTEQLEKKIEILSAVPKRPEPVSRDELERKQHCTFSPAINRPSPRGVSPSDKPAPATRSSSVEASERLYRDFRKREEATHDALEHRLRRLASEQFGSHMKANYLLGDQIARGVTSEQVYKERALRILREQHNASVQLRRQSVVAKHGVLIGGGIKDLSSSALRPAPHTGEHAYHKPSWSSPLKASPSKDAFPSGRSASGSVARSPTPFERQRH